MFINAFQIIFETFPALMPWNPYQRLFSFRDIFFTYWGQRFKEVFTVHWTELNRCKQYTFQKAIARRYTPKLLNLFEKMCANDTFQNWRPSYINLDGYRACHLRWESFWNKIIIPCYYLFSSSTSWWHNKTGWKHHVLWYTVMCQIVSRNENLAYLKISTMFRRRNMVIIDTW